MESSRLCTNCRDRTIISDDDGNLLCSSCGFVQDFNNFQHHFGGISGPTGTFVHTGTAGSGSVYNYKETKIYNAKRSIENITSLLNFSASKKDEVRVMVETITEGEYGQGDWFLVLIGACAYVVMRKDNKSLPLIEVGNKVGCDIYELGRMVNRVVQSLQLQLPEFDMVNSFQRAVQTCFGAGSVGEYKIERMLKQGIFLVQCMVKWYLTTGRRPLPVVVAVLVFVAQLNEVEVRIQDVALELHAAVVTCKLRYKELLESLVKVAQVLPWGKDITGKNIIKNAPFVLQYMELKSMSKCGEKKGMEHIGFNIDDLIGNCLSKEAEYGLDSDGVANDSHYFKVQDKSTSPRWAKDDLETLKLSHECLSMIYAECSNEVLNADAAREGQSHNRRKRGRGLELTDCREWWRGKSKLSKKLFLKTILKKDVGLNAMPPSFVAGCLAYQRRGEKIKAAKLRIDKIMCPQNGDSGDNATHCVLERTNVGKKQRMRIKVDLDWEDFIIETLLLHQVEEEEIEKGYYNTLLDLHVFNY